MRNNSSTEYNLLNWFDLILRSRRKYTFNRLQELDGFHSVSLRRVLKWFYLDVCFIFQQSKNIGSEIWVYGSSIKKQYEVSYLKQVLQQFYLVFILRVSLKHYRGYLLFKKDRWKMVRQFTYENYPVQLELVNNTFPDEQQIFDNKLNFYRHCLKNSIFTPPVLGVFQDGQEIITGKASFELPEEDLFVKELCGRRGQGITKYNFHGGAYINSENSAFNPDELLQLLRDQSCNNEGMIIQKPLQNHQEWRKFTSGALATCRVLTGKRPGSDEIVVLAATLRMPVGSTETDNTSTGGIACAVDIGTGILGKGIRKTPHENQFEFDRHPGTNRLISGTKVPFWKDLLDFAIQAHRGFNTAFVGWDIALTKNGFTLVEGNIGWSVRIVESPQARALSQTQFPILYESWMKKQNR